MIAFALGRRELGKTTLSYSMAQSCAVRVLLDPRGLIRVTHGVRVRTIDELDAAMSRLGEPIDDGGITEIIVTPDADVQGLFIATADHVKRWSIDYAHAGKSRRLFFLVDEARFFRLMDNPPFEYLLRASPPELIYIVITAHRPADIPTDIRAIGDHWLLFRCAQEHDLKVIEQRCGSQVASAVAKLDRYQFIDWDDATGTPKAFLDPSAWYVPMRGTKAEMGDILPRSGSALSEIVDTGKLPLG